MSSKTRVYFLHPDLGIGGAERLIVDAALGLQQSPTNRYHVTIFTSHHDHSHCFAETLSTLTVRVYGDWLPQSLGGRGKIVCAIVRNWYCALMMMMTEPRPDAIIVDQLSASLPLFRLWSIPILFYCHFPDLRLALRGSALRALYRAPFDWLEAWTMSFATRIMVNSAFTRKIFQLTFPSLDRNNPPSIVYPSINFENYQSLALERLDDSERMAIEPLLNIPGATKCFVSINRFERKKNIGLAVRAFALLVERMAAGSDAVKLIVAGGYDALNQENVDYLPELRSLCQSLSLTHSQFPATDGRVTFLPSFSGAQRQVLLERSAAIVYTPENEHFGIVPIEAMYARVPVIACNSGGPVESIDDGVTGYLCEPTPEAFAQAMFKVSQLTDKQRAAMGESGRSRVLRKFSLTTFVDAFDQSLQSITALQSTDRQSVLQQHITLMAVAIFVLSALLLVAAVIVR